jgi:hypothetical protein
MISVNARIEITAELSGTILNWNTDGTLTVQWDDGDISVINPAQEKI